VKEVTDDKSLPKAERKRRQVETASKKSDRARMIKMADKTSNINTILASPPADWSAERKREYFLWAAKVVAGCRGVNPVLEAGFDAAYRRGADLGLI
jgi:guanosine-3',5'-bis(diphosphate) 3'-pyrophosphohydrolase